MALIACCCLYYICTVSLRIKQFWFSRRQEKIIMGTSADYKPFEYKDGDNIVGFDVDLAKALAKKAGYEIEVQDMDFNSLITALKSKQIDMVLSGMTPTPERKNKSTFLIFITRRIT